MVAFQDESIHDVATKLGDYNKAGTRAKPWYEVWGAPNLSYL